MPLKKYIYGKNIIYTFLVEKVYSNIIVNKFISAIFNYVEIHSFFNLYTPLTNYSTRFVTNL